MKSPAVLVCLVVALLVCGSSGAEDKSVKNGTSKVNLANGSFYMLVVPKNFKNDGKGGAFLCMHGAGGTPDHVVQGFESGRVNKVPILEAMNCIGIFPKSKGDSWVSDETTPVDALEDVKKTIKIDDKRVHVCGYSAGGFMASIVFYDKPELFASLTTFASFVAITDPGIVKASIEKPVFIIVGETDQNRPGGEQCCKSLKDWGSRWVRIKVVPGGHMFPFQNEFPTLFKYYKAAESGYDYPAAIDEAAKLITENVEKATGKIAEIESKPHEDGFDEEIVKLKESVNEKGDKDIAAILAKADADLKKAIAALKDLERVYRNYPVVEKIKKARKSLESKL
ncbi:MAG: hypothetical protein WC712_05290 [Candidatus Brocadiia bacterium]